MGKDKDLYKPLPNNECIKLTIEKSKVEGLGLFTQLFVPKGVNFGVSHIKIQDEIIRTPLGGFINHSDEPNCEKIKLQTDNYYKYNLVAIKDITGGDELTVKYLRVGFLGFGKMGKIRYQTFDRMEKCITHAVYELDFCLIIIRNASTPKIKSHWNMV
jgi:predicted DNA-binding WGR domain protein